MFSKHILFSKKRSNMKAFTVKFISQAIVSIFVSSFTLAVHAEKLPGELVGPSLFFHTERTKDEKSQTKEDLDALVDELQVQFDLFMVEVFKAFTYVYLPRREQHADLTTDKFETLVKERRALLTKWCKPGIDDQNQLYSLECRDDDLAPLKIVLGHPVYNNLIVGINRHSLKSKLRDDKNRIATKVSISQKQNMFNVLGDRLIIGTHTREEETLAVIVIYDEVTKLYCPIFSFNPIKLEESYWPADVCAVALQESIAVLKRLNKDL